MLVAFAEYCLLVEDDDDDVEREVRSSRLCATDHSRVINGLCLVVVPLDDARHSLLASS